MAGIHFTQRVAIRGINPYLLVSARHAQQLRPGWRKPLPVRVRIDGQPRSPARVNLMPAGDGTFYLYLNGPLREASGTGVGDRVTAQVAFDASYRGGPTHALPPPLERALRGRATVARAWAELAPSRQKEVLRYLASLRTDEARERNVVKLLAALRQPGQAYLGRALLPKRRARAAPSS